MSAINGAALFKSRCSFCHTVEPNGDNKNGPNVFGIVNSKAAQKKYAYSSALKKANITWTPEALDKYLENSKGFIPGTKMVFALKDRQMREDVIAYMTTLSK